jgi:hypothetical protein
VAEDYIAGTLGDRNRNTAIGKDIAQHDTRTDNIVNNNFNRRDMRDSFEDGLAEGMGEITRIIREFTARIALLEYKISTMQEDSARRNKYHYVMFLLLAVILWKLFYGGY